jgi:hypothetical protein
MHTKRVLDDLNKRLKRLTLNQAESSISDAHRQTIAEKFEKKSLQELNEIAHQLEVKVTRPL